MLAMVVAVAGVHGQGQPQPKSVMPPPPPATAVAAMVNSQPITEMAVYRGASRRGKQEL